jgi:bifunctional hydroxylase/dehydrase
MDAAVIVAGAGPSGLMLAGELRLAGAEVILLDRLPAPTGESRGLGFTARTMEVFDQRGLLDWFGDLETTTQGHFGGLPVDFGVLPGAHAGVKGIPQARTEEMLADWVTGLGVDIRRGHQVVGLDTDSFGVDVTVRTPHGTQRLRCSYLVGCDGGRSMVRKLAGFDFPGTASTMEMFLADVRGSGIRPRMIGETVAGGMVMAGPIGEDVDRIIVCERGTTPGKRTAPPAFAEIADAWQRLTGEDISGGDPVWTSAFGDATRQVTEYRRGRVLLAGDAAHIHLPAGGQGMNTSIQDAVNLGWKLAAVVAGWAPPWLLDTYHHERYPVGARLLMNTQAQGLLFLRGDEVAPLRKVFAELIEIDAVGRHLAGMVSGLEIRYDMGAGGHPLLGSRVPHHELVSESGDKSTTTELLRAGRGVLLDFADDAEVRRVGSAWAGRVDVVTAAPHAAEPGSVIAETAGLLVRPDGHVAWASSGGGGLPDALYRWFGAPR